MKHFVEFALEDGGCITVEVEEQMPEGTVRAGRGDTIAKAKETFESALDKILPVTKSVVKKLRDLESAPDEIEVSFGIKLSTVAGAVIASASAEANFDVTMRWSMKETTTKHSH